MGDLEYKRRHKEQGLCTQCSRQAVSGFTRCSVHIESHYHISMNWQKKHRNLANEMCQKIKFKRRKEGRCPQCGTPLNDEVDAGCISCLNCRLGVMRPRWASHGTTQNKGACQP